MGPIGGCHRMTALEASTLVIHYVRELRSARAEREAWRLLALAALDLANQQHRELEMVDARRRTYQRHLQEAQDIWADQADLRRCEAA